MYICCLLPRRAFEPTCKKDQKSIWGSMHGSLDIEGVEIAPCQYFPIHRNCHLSVVLAQLCRSACTCTTFISIC